MEFIVKWQGSQLIEADSEGEALRIAKRYTEVVVVCSTFGVEPLNKVEE